MNFLINNGFDFQLPLTEGIAYLSKQEEENARSKWIDDDTRKSGLADLDIKQDDVALIDHVRVSISRWQHLGDLEKPSYLNVPHHKPPKGVPKSLGRYQLRLVHQVVQNEFPGLKTIGMKNFIQITNPTDEERANESAALERRREEEISKAIGFRWLIDALAGKPIARLPDKYVINAATTGSQQLKDETPLAAYLRDLQDRLSGRRKILVGHNCLTDLVNLYACFIGEPPESIDEFCSQIHNLFPAVIDTKYLASSGMRGNNTALADVELDLRSQSLPLIELPRGFDRYDMAEKYHEAGYDSFLTAKLMLKLAANLYQDGEVKAGHDDNASGTDFGRDHSDGYGTTAESITDSESAGTKALGTISGALSTVVTVFKAFFGLGSSEASKNEDGSAQSQDQDAESLTPPGEKVVAIGPKPVDWSRTTEVKAVKGAFASVNTFEALKEGSSASGEHRDDDAKDLTSLRSDEEATPWTNTKSQAEEEELPRRKTLASMVGEGEIMPRWDDSQFWATFGNKLQVNSSQERVLKLV